MPKRKPPTPVAPSGLLDVRAPIITRFEDGREVGSWMAAMRAGSNPTVDLLDQLKAAGWEHVSVQKIEEIIDQRRRQPIHYSAISNILTRKGSEIELELTDINGRKHAVALCRNEFTLLHGHTINTRGPERSIRLRIATSPGTFSGLLLATS